MVFITGDIHGEVESLSNARLKYLNHTFTNEDYMIICGDFGVIWGNDKQQKHSLQWLAEKPFKTLFIAGNHENYDLLEQYPVSQWNGGKIQNINDKVYRLMNGQIFDIGDYRFFTMGGASSHDITDGILEPNDSAFSKKYRQLKARQACFRVNHVSWWCQEIPSEYEMDEGRRNLEKVGWSVDVVLTHCAPTSIHKHCSSDAFSADVLTDYLENIAGRLNCHRWYFGHYHGDIRFGDPYRMLYKKVICLDKELKTTAERT